MQRPQLRTATLTRRSARSGYPEPDDFEGLPVRQWRQEWVKVAPSAQQDTTEQGDLWAVELPFGMPKESHLLPAHTQELLRAARSGRIYKRSAPSEEEELDLELDVPKGDKKDWEPPSEGYTAKVWKQVARNAESPTISHLAKRHKNTVTLAPKTAVPQATGPTVIRATVRRIDAAGNPYEQTVTLAEGQQVEGEIISTTVVPTSVAAQGEMPLQQPTPVRRRPPPPKRKAKGAGRGRKKGKLPLPLPLPLPATRSQATGTDGSPIKSESVGPGEPAVKIEDTEDSANQDSEMADMSGVPSEDEEGDGGEGEEEDGGDEEAGDDEGVDTPNAEDISEDTRGEDVEDSEMSEVIQPSSVEEPDEARPAVEEVEEVTIPRVRFQPPSLTNLGPAQLGASRIEGSPLKNVMVLSPTEASPMISPQGASTSFSASSYLEVQSRTVAMGADSGGTVHEAIAGTKAQGILPSLREGTTSEPGSNSIKQEVATPPVEVSAPAFANEASETPASAPDQPQRAAEPDTAAPPLAEVSEPTKSASPTPQTTGPEPMQTDADATPQPPDSPALLPTVTDDEDDGLNLLGSLERELDRQEGPDKSTGEATPAATAAAPEPTTTAATVTDEATTTAAADAPQEVVETSAVVDAPQEPVEKVSVEVPQEAMETDPVVPAPAESN